MRQDKIILKSINTRFGSDRHHSNANSRLRAGCLMGYSNKMFSPVSCNDVTRSPGLANMKKVIWCTLLSIQNEAISLAAMRSKELWLVQENHATVKLDSSVASRGMKTDSESRIELRNLQILKKMLEKWSQFLSSEQPCEPKSSDFHSDWKNESTDSAPGTTSGEQSDENISR